MDERKVIIQPLNKNWYDDKVAGVHMLRLDLLDPVISGNKWYKLKLNIRYALDNNYKTIVTFGGGFSNHLIATSAMAAESGLKSVGIVRGTYKELTPTLQACKEAGMELVFISKEEYKDKQETRWLKKLTSQFDNLYIIPEGGANEWGRKGAGLINRFIKDSYTHIAVSVGTGTTFIGLRNKTAQVQQLIGFVPMKEGAYLTNYIGEHLQTDRNHNWDLYDEWHFGGFGKWNKELIAFMNEFYVQNKIPLDIIYTGKMMYGVQQMLQKNVFPADAHILCIHTGGLQGNASIQSALNY